MRRVFRVFLFTMLFSMSAISSQEDNMTDYQREIEVALNNTVLSRYIVSVEILPLEELQKECDLPDPNILGCTVSWFNDATNKFEYANIYLYDFTGYTGCKTFSRVLYHEIGHVEYFHHHGAFGSESVREQAADKYADYFVEDECIIS